MTARGRPHVCSDACVVLASEAPTAEISNLLLYPYFDAGALKVPSKGVIGQYSSLLA
jgi:hypothetical protein